MADREIFQRTYTPFTPAGGGTTVYILNGGSSVFAPTDSLITLTAGETLIKGDAVYASGTFAHKASAGKNLNAINFAMVGFTTEAATVGNDVQIDLDGSIILSSANILADTGLTPGTVYYLSNVPGQITEYGPTSSGVITNASGYLVSKRVGTALSTTRLNIEIQPAVTLVE